MCGRFALYSTDQIQTRFDLSTNFKFAPTYNAAPGQNLPVIINDNGQHKAVLMRWGLVPSWAKDPQIGYRLINARSDSVAIKPSFRHAFAHQHCLIPANGFYEWQKAGKKSQQYFFKPQDNNIIAFAGLWEKWQPPGGNTLYSFTIITSDPNPLVKPVHDRMPVILEAEHENPWLQSHSNRDIYESLLLPYPKDNLSSHPVSALVNNAQNNSSDLIAPTSLL